MLYQAKNGIVELEKGRMDYLRFGTGGKIMILLPGLGEALQSIRGMALPMAFVYREFTKDFTVYMFARREPLAMGETTADMAEDLARAMEKLGITQADVVGVSMGGMIAQHLAIRHPEKVGKLVLAVTCGKANETVAACMETWLDCARRGDHTALMDSNVKLIYSEDYYRKNKVLVPLMGKLTKPKSYDRFFIQAQACLTHDAAAQLTRITAPTLVLGGEKDRVVGSEAAQALAGAIPGAVLKVYPQWGHGLYEEEKSFNRTVREFLLAEE